MSAKKQENRFEIVRDAATGYAVIVLALLCFVLVLVAVMFGVRVVTGVTSSATTAATTTVITGGTGAT